MSSRERVSSLDHTLRDRRQKRHVCSSAGYISGRSPNQSPHRINESPRQLPSSPDILRASVRNAYSFGLDPLEAPRIVQYGCDVVEKSPALHTRDVSPNVECYKRRFPQLKNLPEELIDEYAEPSFYEPSPNDTYDELMCVLATPPAPTPSSSPPPSLRQINRVAKVADVVSPEVKLATYTDKQCRRVAEYTADREAQKPLCQSKMEALPDDPYVIPPHPKDPKDVVGIIRRTRAIQRLKAMQEREAAKNILNTNKKPGRGTMVCRKQSIRRPLVSVKPTGQIKKSDLRPPKATSSIKKNLVQAHPAVPPQPEYNKNILKMDQEKTPLTHSPTKQPPTYENILQRAADIRAKMNAAKAQISRQKTSRNIPFSSEIKSADDSKDQLDEFEALEELYNARPTQAPALQRVEDTNIISDRIKDLQHHLYQSPASILVTPRKKSYTAKTQSRKSSDDLKELLDEFEGLEQLHKEQPVQGWVKPTEADANILGNRIADLQRHLFETPVAMTSPLISSADLQDQLDEFETLEQLYNAGPVEGTTNLTEADANILGNRIEDLQRHLLDSPLLKKSPSKKITCTPKTQPLISSGDFTEQLDEFEALEQLYNAQPVQGAAEPQKADANILGNRIEDLQRHLFESPAEKMCPRPRYYDHDEVITQPISIPVDNCGEEVQHLACRREQVPDYADAEYATEDDIALDDITMPLLDMDDVTNYAEVRADGECAIEDEIALDDISMPYLDMGDVSNYAEGTVCSIEDEIPLDDISMPCDVMEQNATYNETGLEDITSPELNDLSICLQEPLLPQYRKEGSAKITEDEQAEDKSPGFLNTVVNAVVDKFRNMFGATTSPDEDTQSFNRDSSLPNLFESTPQARVISPCPQTQKQKQTPLRTTQQQPSSERTPVIPPHPKDPRDYAAMVKRAQVIQKLKAKEVAANMPPQDTRIKNIPATKSRPQEKPRTKKKKPAEQPTKLYAVGEYSPGYAAAVARARTLAGFKNRSAVLNPQRAAKIAALKAAEEALPPVERMQRRIARMVRKQGKLLCLKPSIETLGTLEAIRENLPKIEQGMPSKSKWTPAERREFRKSPVFTKKIERAFEHMKPMTPIKEESLEEIDLLKFSPLRAHEAKLRLQNLQQLANRDGSVVEVLPQTGTTSTPVIRAADQYTPLRLQSPMTEKRRKETVTTKLDKNGGGESMREEIIEMSTIVNGEVQRSTRKVTTKTDSHGNVISHSVEDGGLMEEIENIESIEAPDFLDTSFNYPVRDPSLPTPSQLIERIRIEIKQKLNIVLPEVPPPPEDIVTLKFPDELPDEQLVEVDMPELETTPRSPTAIILQPNESSPNVSLPYCWGEIPLPQRSPSPKKVSTPKPLTLDVAKAKPKTPQGQVVIPPHPKDPKDYRSMVKRAQAIQKLRAQQEAEKQLVSAVLMASAGKDPAKTLKKKKMLKSKPKIHKAELSECPAEPRAIPPDYAAAVARARHLAGYKNTTALLNPQLAEQLAAKRVEEAAELAAFEALPAYQKILKRMEKLRGLPQGEKPKIEPTVDVLGTIAAIKSTMSPLPLTCPTPLPVKTILGPSEPRSRDKRLHDSPDMLQCPATHDRELPALQDKQAMVDSTINVSLDEFETLERQMAAETSQIAQKSNMTDISLREFEAFEKDFMENPDEFVAPISQTDATREEPYLAKRMTDLERKLYESSETPKIQAGARRPRNLINELSTAHTLSRIPEKESAAMDDQRQQVPVNNQLFYEELIADLAFKQNELSSLNRKTIAEDLMPLTPVGPIERIREIKAKQQNEPYPKTIAVHEETYDMPSIDYIPITLVSPSKPTCPQEVSPKKVGMEEVLLDLQTPKELPKCVKQFKDLEDMPFDELEFEDEPTLTNISFGSPKTPPPKPSELIERIREQVHKQLREENPYLDQSVVSSPCNLEFPIELPEEQLWELSAPSFVQTPLSETPKSPKTPHIYLPYIWEEVAVPTTTEVGSNPLTLVTQQPMAETVMRSPKALSAEDPLIIPPHPKDPKDYRAMVKRAQAIHKLRKQMEAENIKSPSKQKPSKRFKKIIKKSKGPTEKQNVVVQEDTTELPPFPEGYAEAVARARQLAGYKNRTAALNPAIAAKMAHRKAAEEAEALAFSKLPQHEKLKARMDRLRAKVLNDRPLKLTMEQRAFVEHMKDAYGNAITKTEETGACCPTEKLGDTPLHMRTQHKNLEGKLSITPRATQRDDMAESQDSLAVFEALEQLSATPCPRPTDGMTKARLNNLAQFERLERELSITPRATQRDNDSLAQFEALEQLSRLERTLSKTPRSTQEDNDSLAQFEALEQLESSQSHICRTLPIDNIDLGPRIAELQKNLFTHNETDQASEHLPAPTGQPPLELSQMIAEMQRLQLATPPQIDPQERYQQLLKQMQALPKIPKTPTTPLKTPEIHYSPINLDFSSSTDKNKNRNQKLTTHLTKSGDQIIREQIRETSEIVNGELKHVKEHITTTSNPYSDHQLNDISANTEELENIGEPSFLDTTPISPRGVPRPRDIISRIQRDVLTRPKLDVPTGRLIELNTPPRELPLPQEVPEEELFEITCPTIPKTPTATPIRTPERALNISMPEIFMETPAPPTPLPAVSPLRFRVPSPEGPIIVPPHPKDPTDYIAMVRRARKIQQLKAQQEAEAAQKALKAKKKYKKLSSKSTIPSAISSKKKLKSRALPETPRECPMEPPVLPAEYIEAVARARRLAGLKVKTTEKPKTISSHPTDIRLLPPAADLASVRHKIALMREQGSKPLVQPSMDTIAYVEALKTFKEVMEPSIREEPKMTPKSPETRYRRIINARAGSTPTMEYSPVCTPHSEDVHYTPIRFVSPDASPKVAPEEAVFDMANFEDLPDIDELCELQEPSFSAVSQIEIGQTSKTPPPTPSVLISRIREQVHQKLAKEQLVCPSVVQTPPPIRSFPRNLDEENIFELSSPCLVKTPQRQPTPRGSPNVSLPQYFEPLPSPLELSTPKATPKRSQKTTEEDKSEGSELPADYVAAVLRARQLEGLKNTTAQKPPQDYNTIKARAAAIQARIGQNESTSSESAHVQKLIKRRQLGELEQRRLAEQGKDIDVDLGQTLTPRPIRERYKALKSRMATETPTTSRMTHSPVKTPDVTVLPAYQPIQLAPSPLCPVLQNISEPDIGDISIPPEFPENNSNDPTNSRDQMEGNFDINRRIKFLQNQYLQSPCAPPELSNLADVSSLAEFEYLEQNEEAANHPPFVSQRLTNNDKQMTEALKRLESLSRAQEMALCGKGVGEKSFNEMKHTPQYTNIEGELSGLDSFEAMEKLCELSGRMGENSLPRSKHLWSIMKHNMRQSPRKSTVGGEYNAVDSFEAMERLCGAAPER